MIQTIPKLDQWVWEAPPALVPENRPLEPAPIRMLIDDVLIDVFSFVTDAQDICALERVCKKFHFISRTCDSLWKRRFGRLWPKIEMLPPNDTSSEAQFKILNYELSKTEKQLRKKIIQIRGNNGNNGTLNLLWDKMQTASVKMQQSTLFGILVAKDAYKKFKEASAEFNYEQRFLYDCVGSFYDGTDASITHGSFLDAQLKRKRLFQEGDNATTEFIKIIDIYKKKFGIAKHLFFTNLYFEIMCVNRLSEVTQFRLAPEKGLIEAALKNHLNGKECELRKKYIDRKVSLFKIHQWLPLCDKETTYYLEGKVCLRFFFASCSCCKSDYRYYSEKSLFGYENPAVYESQDD